MNQERPGSRLWWTSLGVPGGGFLAGESALAILAKRNRSQAIENKRSREMTDFAPINDVKDLRSGRETPSFRFAN